MKKVFALMLVALFLCVPAYAAQKFFDNVTGTQTATWNVNAGARGSTVQVNFTNYSGVFRRDLSADDGNNYVAYDNISGVNLNGSYLLHQPANSAPTNMRGRLIPHNKGARKRGTVSGYFNAN